MQSQTTNRVNNSDWEIYIIYISKVLDKCWTYMIDNTFTLGLLYMWFWHHGPYNIPLKEIMF